MKLLRNHFTVIIILAALIAFPACKAKKLPQKPAVDQTPAPVAPVATAPPPPPVVQPTPAPATEKPDYNFTNIQFEFDSSVLKTDSYAFLDKAAAAMKIDPTIKFNLKGYASEEGTPEHNMLLSEDRANSVKSYLINSGVSANNITATGYGTSNPIADNNTEAGRVLNRRVEISKQN